MERSRQERRLLMGNYVRCCNQHAPPGVALACCTTQSRIQAFSLSLMSDAGEDLPLGTMFPQDHVCQASLAAVQHLPLLHRPSRGMLPLDHGSPQARDCCLTRARAHPVRHTSPTSTYQIKGVSLASKAVSCLRTLSACDGSLPYICGKRWDGSESGCVRCVREVSGQRAPNEAPANHTATHLRSLRPCCGRCSDQERC